MFLRNFLLLQTNEKQTIFKPNANYLSEWNAIKCLVISITYGPRNFKHCQSTEERERERIYKAKWNEERLMNKSAKLI